MPNQNPQPSRLEGLFAALPKADPEPAGPTPLAAAPPGPVVPAPFETELAPDALAVVPGWTWELDAAGVLTACSSQARVHLGTPIDDLLGRTLVEHAATHEAGQELGGLLARRRPLVEVRLPLQHRNGTAVWVSLSALPRLDEAGAFVGYRGAAQLAGAPAITISPAAPAAPNFAAVDEPGATAVEAPAPVAEASSSETVELLPVVDTFSAEAAEPLPDVVEAALPEPPIVTAPAERPTPEAHTPLDAAPAPEAEPVPARPAVEAADALPAPETEAPPILPSTVPPAPPAPRGTGLLRPLPAPAPPTRPAPGLGLGAAWGYLASEDGLEPIGDWTAPEADQAQASGQLVVRGSAPAEGDAEAGQGRALAVPIRLNQGHTVGVLEFFDENERRDWSEDDLALVQAVSDQLGLALENARLFSETREYLEKQTLLYEVTHAAASAVNLNMALNSAAEALARVLPDADVAILLLDEGQDYLRVRAAVGFPTELIGSLRIRVGEGITGWVAKHNRPALIADVRSDARYVAGAPGMRSEAAVPLALGDRVIGVLNVESPRASAFDDEDVQLLSTLAGTLAAIIVNNNLLTQITQERERLAVLYDVLQGLIARPERADILETALRLAPRLGAEHAYVLMLGQHPGEHTFRSTLPALDNLDPRAARELAHNLAEYGLEGWVIAHQRAAVVDDTQADERWRQFIDAPVRTVISVPLKTQRGSLTGVLGYTHSQPGALGAAHLPQIESIAGQVAVALENALLRQQQSIQNYNAAALARAAQALTRTLSESELHQIVSSQLFETYRPNGVALLRWEPGTRTFSPLAVHVSDDEMPDDRAAWPAMGQSFNAERRPDLLEVIQTRQGRLRLLRTERDDQVRETMALPLLYGGEIEGVAEIVHTGPAAGLNAGDLELFQAILTAAASALQSARLYELQRQTAERLAEVDRLKSQFLANMSHELRTPLNSIIGFSRVILKGIDGPLSDLQVQDLTSINNAGQHLLGLINDILDMARIEAGKMDLVLDDIDLRDTIRGVLSTTVALVKEKPVRLHEEVADDLPKVRADPMRIRQVLLNLLSNAAKFTDNGSITLRAQAVQAVAPRTGRLEPFVEVSIIDTGMGMAPEDLPKLFEPFSQVDASATRKVGGTGLGLSICRQLVELHNGRIWVESEEGHGSTFTFILPVAQPETPAPDTAAPAGTPATVSEPPRPIVLVVDDDQAIAALYRRYLEPHGYRVHGVSKSTEAITRAAELRPVCVLLDVLMPNKDGWQVLADLKRSEITRDIPVIMCTLTSDPERAADLGAADYLTKPILEADLLRAIKKLPAHGVGRSASVLVIEDRSDDVALVRRALAPNGTASGLRVLEAHDGQTGLTLAHHHRPQAIILDMQMPDMNGFQVLAALRNDPQTRDIPVIVVTASELSAEQQARLTHEAAAWRQKGHFAAEELAGDLQRVLGLAPA